MEFVLKDNPLDALIRLENKKIIREKLRKLDPKHCLIIRLFYWSGKNYKEIATIINSTPNSVGATLTQIRIKLRNSRNKPLKTLRIKLGPN